MALIPQMRQSINSMYRRWHKYPKWDRVSISLKWKKILTYTTTQWSLKKLCQTKYIRHKSVSVCLIWSSYSNWMQRQSGMISKQGERKLQSNGLSCRVSVLQNGKVSELCFATTQMQPALLNCTLKTSEDGYDLWFVSFLTLMYVRVCAHARTHTRKVSTESHV